MSRFMLVLRDDPSRFADISPSEMQAIIERYQAWGKNLGDRHVGGNKLTDGTGAAVLRGAGPSTVVTDGPYGETKEVVSGFFLIEADSLAHAKELCRDHPGLDFGSIEIRQVDLLEDCAAEGAAAGGSARS